MTVTYRSEICRRTKNDQGGHVFVHFKNGCRTIPNHISLPPILLLEHVGVSEVGGGGVSGTPGQGGEQINEFNRFALQYEAL